MKKLLVLLSGFVLLSIQSRGQTHEITVNNFKCTYETSNGRMNGLYASYYNNGQKRAEGKFENNNRTGRWTLHDSTGNIRIQRDYATPFGYKQTIFKDSAATTKKLSTAYNDPLDYNADGYIDYFGLQENIMIWTRRIMRYIAPDGNKALFENNRLFNLLIKNVSEGKITAYQDNNFSKTETVKFNAYAYQVIGYRIMEDNLFDKVRLLHETRILGLCPVVINIQKQDTIDLCWFYFPDLRKGLALEKTNQSNSKLIKTLDDLFFYRDFSGQIYKEQNVFNRSIASYMKGKEAIDKEAELIEISLSEFEHDLWLDILKK